ncbi:MAG: metallophosphoesterase family protein [Spirochaetales bacterium]|nr:metallophosphoesterase family protein [Spirochaetales bacterium]
MKALVLSDIHGNWEALSAVLEDATQFDWEEILFLGDLCGYGPDSELCFDRLREERLTFLCGNHDLYMSGELKGDNFSDTARKALLLGRADLHPELRLFLKHQPPERRYRGIKMVHGSPIEPCCTYILNEYDVQANRSRCRQKLLLFGHTHIQEYYILEKKGPVSRVRPEVSQPEGDRVSYKGRNIWINPGSVGQPRDGDNRAAWGLLNTKKKEFAFHRTTYDYETTQKKLREKGYPEFLIDRLALGK